MSAADGRWSVRFPDLFKDQYADYAGARLSFTTAAVPADLVSRLHLVAVTPARPAPHGRPCQSARQEVQ